MRLRANVFVKLTDKHSPQGITGIDSGDEFDVDAEKAQALVASGEAVYVDVQTKETEA